MLQSFRLGFSKFFKTVLLLQIKWLPYCFDFRINHIHAMLLKAHPNRDTRDHYVHHF